jgi:predicted metal-binding membrane protein
MTTQPLKTTLPAAGDSAQTRPATAATAGPSAPGKPAATARPSVPARPVASAAALTATLGLAAGCWVIALRDMQGMNMGTATQLGSFLSFFGIWVVMMAAMMLPGAAPAVVRRSQAGGISAVPLFIGSYLAVWAAAGAVVYAAYRPHGTLAAGAVVIAAAIYEVTPIKRHFRRRCGTDARSGFSYGLCCAGATLGLMAMLLAVGVMSITWMAVIGVLITAQKLLPARFAIDLPVALVIAGLGVLILVAPSMVPGLSPPM